MRRLEAGGCSGQFCGTKTFHDLMKPVLSCPVLSLGSNLSTHLLRAPSLCQTRRTMLKPSRDPEKKVYLSLCTDKNRDAEREGGSIKVAQLLGSEAGIRTHTIPLAFPRVASDPAVPGPTLLHQCPNPHWPQWLGREGLNQSNGLC